MKKRKALILFALSPFMFLCACSAINNADKPTTKDEGILYIVSKPTKTTFNVGESFTYEGISVIDTKTNNDIVDFTTSIKPGYSFTYDDIGDRAVIVSKQGYSSTYYSISVKDMPPLEIDTYPQLTYTVGDYFSLAGMVVKSGDEVITGYSCDHYSGSRLSKVGQEIVTISKYGYASVSFRITINDLPPLEIKSYPKTRYIAGETLSFDDLVIGSGDETFDDYYCNYQAGVRLSTPGNYEIYFSKEGYNPITLTIVVEPKEAMKIAHTPNKIDYFVGENLSLTGLVVTDSSGNVLTGYTTSIADGELLKLPGERSIIVSKDGYSDVSFTINVEEAPVVVDTTKNVKIYYLNDTHGSFIRQSFVSSTNEAGMAYISTYIKNNVKNDKAAGNVSVILSGGDMFQGGLESNETHGQIMIDAMNIIGFDAMVLGNHEFDWGEEYIYQFAESLNCPIISANTFYTTSGDAPSYVTPYVILQKDDVKIGIIGAAEDGMGSSITGSISSHFSFPAATKYIKEHSNTLRLTHNCDLVIGAFHDGGYEADNGETQPTKFSSLTEINVETGRKYVDAMFFAHDHARKAGDFNGVPFLEAGCNGRYIGVMTLTIKGNGYAYTEVDSYSTNNIYAYSSCTTSDPYVAELTTKYAAEIGNPDEILYRFTKEYSREAFTVIACEAMYWYVNSHLSHFDNTRVYLATHNTGGIRSYPIPKGDFTRRDLVKVFPFDNPLYIQTCSETHIRNLKNSDYYGYYQEEEPVYSGGYTHAVSIGYIAESENYSWRYQKSAKKYDITAKNALVEFLRQKIRNDL